MVVVDIQDVSMQFRLNREGVNTFKEYMLRKIKRDLTYDEFWALKHVSLQVHKGENIGIIGLNGSGKSTLLKIIAGVLRPTTGTVTVVGRMAPLIELGAGFDQNLTAQENIYLNGALLGNSRKYMDKYMAEIIDFAELDNFINVPIKNFSSGMVARLGFSIATLVRPEILILDEILAVGDYQFQQKCMIRMQEMMSQGTTVLYVGHQGSFVETLCDNALWLDHGEVKMYGAAAEVVAAYEGRESSPE